MQTHLIVRNQLQTGRRRRRLLYAAALRSVTSSRTAAHCRTSLRSVTRPPRPSYSSRVPCVSPSSSPRGRSAPAAVVVVCDEFSFENKGPPAVYRGASSPSSHGSHVKKAEALRPQARRRRQTRIKRRKLGRVVRVYTIQRRVLPSLLRSAVCSYVRPSVPVFFILSSSFYIKIFTLFVSSFTLSPPTAPKLPVSTLPSVSLLET